MWHGKSHMNKASGYSHSRTVRRGGQDSSIRNSNKAEAAYGMVGVVVLGIMFLAFIGLFF
jgi:hypothetical protein